MQRETTHALLTGDDPAFVCQVVPKDVFTGTLREVTDALRNHGVEHAFIGGVGSAVYGRPRVTHDVDLFVRPEDARPTLDALDKAGYLTNEKDQHWLYKAIKHGVLVDVIFKAKGDIYLDDEMSGRIREHVFHGVTLPVVPPEDLVVIKAIVHDEPTPRHWHDALAIVATADLDWDYLLWRARHGPGRVLSLLLYARSNDHPVPDRVLRALFDRIGAT
ncbi:MAG TPA: nucleotidyltransferase [Acidimicrobiales bacterium]